MSMLIAEETPYGQELWRWEHHEGETHPTNKTIRGMRPNGHRAFPELMYKATQKNPWQFEKEVAADEVMQRNLQSRGFCSGGPGKAAEAFDGMMQGLAVAAAHRNYEDRNMSDGAKAHRDAVESSSSVHLGEIPETPIRAVDKKKRGRPAKVRA